MAAVHEACLQFHWVWKDKHRYEMMWKDACATALTSEVKPVLPCLTLQKDLWLAVPVNTWRCGVPWVLLPYPWHRARAGLRCTMITHQVGVYWVNFFFWQNDELWIYVSVRVIAVLHATTWELTEEKTGCGETHHLYLRASLNTWLLLFIF